MSIFTTEEFCKLSDTIQQMKKERLLEMAKKAKRWIPRCCTPTCGLRARWVLDGMPMCTKHKDFYKNDFEKIVKLPKIGG